VFAEGSLYPEGHCLIGQLKNQHKHANIDTLASFALAAIVQTLSTIVVELLLLKSFTTTKAVESSL
jgi:hypothetical protein